jgi:hypothetical protein
MKGTVPRPHWPAPAAETATHTTSKDETQQEERPTNLSNRITLALLEEYSPEISKGYDPYNATAARRPVDAWRRKPKRG